MNAPTPIQWSERLERLAFWVHWNAVISWIIAGLMAISLVGLLVAWLPAWAAWEMTQAKARLRDTAQQLAGPSPTFDTDTLSAAFRHLGRQFVLSLALSAASLLAMGALVLWVVANMPSSTGT